MSTYYVTEAKLNVAPIAIQKYMSHNYSVKIVV